MFEDPYLIFGIFFLFLGILVVIRNYISKRLVDFFWFCGAVPFLGFLLFREDNIRYFFLFFSFFMGAVVLLMHVHYSIDVFSAFFITYGTHKVGEKFFNKVNSYLRR
jgi:hypothetical protein